MISCDLEEFQPDANESAALEYCLSQQIWWSDRAHEFPRLPAASRQHSLLPILKKVKIRANWDRMEYWGQFTTIIIAFSACIPAFNFVNAETKKETSSLIQILTDVRDSVDAAVIPGEKTWSFKQISAVNPEDLPPRLETSSSDADVSLPNFDDIDDNEEDAHASPQTPRRS
jgi:hypothetical protein